jgi:hypothetical protein
MTKFNYSVRKLSYSILLMFFAWFNFKTFALASDDEALKKAFSNLDHFSIEDGDSPWRISQGVNGDYALPQKAIIEGISTSRGEVRLSKQQRTSLYSAWQKTPKQLWLLYYGQIFQVSPVKTVDHYEIQFIKYEDESERKMLDEREKAETARNTPLSVTIYTQANFNAQPFIVDYKNWQKTL